MTLPDELRIILICRRAEPDAEDDVKGGTINDEHFAYLQEQVDDEFSWLEEISPEVFGQWLSNAKKVTSVYRVHVSITYEDATPPFDGYVTDESVELFQHYQEDGDFFHNDSDFPLPLNGFTNAWNGDPEAPAGLDFVQRSDWVTYRPIPDAVRSGLEMPPILFIHRDKLYVYSPEREYVENASFTIDQDQMLVTLVQEYDSPGYSFEVVTTTQSLTINERYFTP